MTKKIGLTLAIILTGLIMWPGSKANAWEICGGNQDAWQGFEPWDSKEAPWVGTAWQTSLLRNDIYNENGNYHEMYFYNKCDPKKENSDYIITTENNEKAGISGEGRICIEPDVWPNDSCGWVYQLEGQTGGWVDLYLYGEPEGGFYNTVWDEYENNGYYYMKTRIINKAEGPWGEAQHEQDYINRYIVFEFEPTDEDGIWTSADNYDADCYCFSNIIPGGPETNNYIMYYNDNPLYIPINGTDNILGAYNICENWDTSATYKIAAIDNDNKPNLALPGLEKTITSCSGVVKIPVNAPASDTMKNVKLAVKKNNKVILEDDSYFLLTIYTPVTEESYIMYYGDNPYYTITNNNLDLRIVYNICGEWDASKNFYLQLIDSESGEPLANRQKITSCSGASRYTQKAGPTESSHTAKVIIYKEPNTTIAETETFIYSVYIPIDSQNWINTDLEPITYVNYETTESTDIKITYKIFYDNIKNSKICMIRKDANNLKTDLCYSELTEGLNFFNIDIPSPEFETLQQISFGLFDGDTLIVESPTYIMSFLSNASISDNIENQLTGQIGWLGLDTRNLACSEAEWESESSFLGINLTKTICSIKKFTLDLTFLGGNITKDFYNSVISGVKNIFPFGLIYNIKKSWIASKNKPLPADISWLAPGDDLDIEVPKNWTKTDENITVTVFGSNIFKNGDPNIANFFAKIRALSTYLLWAGFIWSIYGFGNKFYHQHLKKPTEVDIK